MCSCHYSLAVMTCAKSGIYVILISHVRTIRILQVINHELIQRAWNVYLASPYSLQTDNPLAVGDNSAQLWHENIYMHKYHKTKYCRRQHRCCVIPYISISQMAMLAHAKHYLIQSHPSYETLNRPLSICKKLQTPQHQLIIYTCGIIHVMRWIIWE